MIYYRSGLINAERLVLLRKIDLAVTDAIDGIIDTLARPPLGPAGGDKSYARIFSGLVVGRERERLCCANITTKRPKNSLVHFA